MSKSFLEKFREWDADQYSLDSWPSETPRESSREPVLEIPRLEKLEKRMFYRVYRSMSFYLGLFFCLILVAVVLELPVFGSADSPTQNEVVERYVSKGMEETGAVNTVAGVILDYRAYDTLGESHVLYTALTTVLVLLMGFGTQDSGSDSGDLLKSDRVLTITAAVVVPCVILFGIYVICNGHLGPGGGFSGGAVIGAALILYAIAFGFDRIEKFLNLKTFRLIVLCALCFYSISKGYSFFCGANGLESGITPGIPGKILSAGLILPLNAAVGIVVACTMYGLYSLFKRGRI